MSTAGYLQDAKNQQAKLATNLTVKGVTASATEKYDSLVSKVAQIEELRGEERTLDVLTKYNDTPESIVSIEYPETKNLFDVGKIEDYSYPIISGINLTIEDNSISAIIAESAISAIINTKRNLNSGTYTFSSTNTMSDGSDSKYRYLVRPYDNNGNIITDLRITGWEYNLSYNAYLTNIQKPTIIIPDTVSYWRYGLVFIGTTGATSTYSNIQLEKGSVATSYEPYGIDKKINLQLSSKNLFDISTATKSSGAATFSKTIDTITVSQTVTRTYHSANVEIPKSLVGKTVTISAKSVTSGVNNAAMRIQWCNSTGLATGNMIWGIADSSGNITATGVVPSQSDETHNILCLMFYSNADATLESDTTYTATYSNIQIEYENVATIYTPYITDFSTVNVTACSKNLFDINNVYRPLNTDTYEISNSKLKVYRNRSFVVGAIYHIPLPVGTQYTLYYDIEYGGTATSICNYADSKIFAGKLNKVSYTGTVGDTGYLELEFSRIGGENDKLGWVTYSNIQVELGSTVTSYEPYQGQTYTSTSGGIVTGIQNIYPTTNILTDNASALITVKDGAYKEILPSTDKNGITKIYQEIVGASIDENIKSENIKKDVNILGITGDYICNYSYDETTKELTLIL